MLIIRIVSARGLGRPRFRPALEALEARNLPSFLPPITSPLGPGTGLTAVGDFTGDGIPDLVTVAGTTLRVEPGNGDGSFGSPIDTRGLPSGYQDALAVGDFNGDGNLDVVVTTRGFRAGDPNFVSVLSGNGDGTFQAPMNYQLALAPLQVVVAGFQGDSRPDLVVSTYISAGGSLIGTQVLLNNGDGTFTSTVTLPILHPVVGDFLGDGHLDLAAAAFISTDDLDSTRMHLLLGQGDGTFQESPINTPILQYGAVPVFMATADFSSDGTPELIVGDHTFSDVVILRAAGDASFQTVDSFPGLFPVGGLESGVVGDFNREGLPDFAVAGGSVVRVFLNAGDGGSQPGAAGSHVFGDQSSGVAAVETLVPEARPQPVNRVVADQHPAVIAAPLEALTLPLQPRAVADVGAWPAGHKKDGAEAVDAGGLADPLDVG
jgi:hypothetical protein